MFDAHCDTLLKIKEGAGLESNMFHVSFEKLSQYGKAGQLFAIFNSGELKFSDILNLISALKMETEKSTYAKFCICAYDFEACKQSVAAYVSIEALGNTPDFSPENVELLFRAGVRILSLTWNGDNPLCGGIGKNASGLTLPGRKTVKQIIKLNMALDVSHISDKGFYDVLGYDDLKVLATHSNSRKICENPRNITDEQFELIKGRGGVVGMNTYPLFLNGTDNACVTDLIRHIEHFCMLGGEENICLGADFDGIETTMSDIDSCEKMYILFNELAKLNYTESQINRIKQTNFINFFKSL